MLVHLDSLMRDSLDERSEFRTPDLPELLRKICLNQNGSIARQYSSRLLHLQNPLSSLPGPSERSRCRTQHVRRAAASHGFSKQLL